MNEGIFITDRSGAILYVNQGFANMTGYDASEVVGLPWHFLQVWLCSRPLSCDIMAPPGLLAVPGAPLATAQTCAAFQAGTESEHYCRSRA